MYSIRLHLTATDSRKTLNLTAAGLKEALLVIAEMGDEALVDCVDGSKVRLGDVKGISVEEQSPIEAATAQIPLRTLEQVTTALKKAKKYGADETMAATMLAHGRLTDKARAYVANYLKL